MLFYFLAVLFAVSVLMIVFGAVCICHNWHRHIPVVSWFGTALICVGIFGVIFSLCAAVAGYAYFYGTMLL